LYWVACTRSASSTTFSGHRRLLLISAHPQKNVSLRRSCGACLRRPCGAGVRPLKYPEVPRGRLRRAPPGPAVPCPLPPLCLGCVSACVAAGLNLASEKIACYRLKVVWGANRMRFVALAKALWLLSCCAACALCGPLRPSKPLGQKVEKWRSGEAEK
jgi:hypothetical protein